jgi:hypothetical protein
MTKRVTPNYAMTGWCKAFRIVVGAVEVEDKQNVLEPQAHGSDLAPVKYPTGVTYSSRKYFSSCIS